MESGLDENAIAEQLRETALARLEKAGNYLLERAKANAPKKSGGLVNSGFVRVDRAEGIAYVGFKKFYSKWIEYGFVHSGGQNVPPNPFLRRTLAENRDAIEGILAGDGDATE